MVFHLVIDDKTLLELDRRLGDSRLERDPARLAEFAHDAWPVSIKQRQQGLAPNRPDAVIRVHRVDDVSRTLGFAAEFGIAVTPRGAGSSVVGGPLPGGGGIVLDLTGLDELIELDGQAHTVRVGAGMLGGELERRLAERGFTTHFSPQSLLRSTVGGWVATRATGQFSSLWGGIEDAVVALTVVLADGSVVQTQGVPRAAMGPDIKHLFIGSEGTLGVVVDVTLRIHPLSVTRCLETVTFPSIAVGIDAMRAIMQGGLRPFLMRLYDEQEAPHAMADPDFDRCVMFLGFEGPEAVAEAQLAAALDLIDAGARRRLGAGSAQRWLDRRYDFSMIDGVLQRPGGVAETIEVAHTWSGIAGTYATLKQELAGVARDVLGHFSHAYTNGTSLYLIVLGETEDAAAAQAALENIWKVAMNAALRTGAVLSHHHGVGLARLPYLPAALGDSLDVLRSVKRALDPDGILSPGKLSMEAGRRVESTVSEVAR
jgi:alkyldihydroxyacetonephosphate synthase